MSIDLIKISLAQAWPTSLVPECDPTGLNTAEALTQCNECHLAQMGHNIVMTLIYAAFVIVVIMAISGGFRMFFSGGKPDAIQTARKHITAAITGLIIVLVSWAVLGTLISKFVNADEIYPGWEWYKLEKLDCTTDYTGES